MARPRKARRRGRGEGTVYEKVRRWTTADGKTQTKTFWVAKSADGAIERTGATAAEAREARDGWLREHGQPVPRTQRVAPVTVEQFAQVFLEHRKRVRRAATHQDYSNTFDRHIKPYIGDLKLHELTDEQVIAMYRTVEGKISSSMAKRVHVTLRAMLNYALERKVIQSSPLATIKQDVPRPERKPVQPLGDEQIAALFEASQDDRLGAVFAFAIDVGARQGEIFGLRWDDMDLDRRTVYIVRQVVEHDGHAALDDLKTTYSRRRVEMSPESVAWLRRRKAIALREGLGDCRYVFPAEQGGLLHKSNFLRDTWAPIREAAGLSSTRFHGLRHTCAVLLLREGVNPKVVQQRLGHSSIALTMDTYAAWIPNLQAGAAQAVSRVYGRLGGRRKAARRAA